ncbi:Os11g0593250 [Oryza sativa Japonica Group]|uniref:Os11g0593250 protein n=1 Tax=Oryza sativa subsp. japonica TaxID=39947 RepID=A0A0P0Y3Z4_ORYSJ|nr:Os11g0593250 [Oryza sativa Japonica Group]
MRIATQGGLTDESKINQWISKGQHNNIVWRFAGDGDNGDPPFCTKHLPIFRVDGARRREEARGGVGGELVFLGHEFSACFRAEQFLAALKPRCAYLVDDCRLDEKEYCRQDIGRWEMKRGQMEGLPDDDGGGG